MTADEFDRWWGHFALAFPDSARWVAALPDSAGTLAVWARVLERTDFGDALEAVDRLADGRAAPIQAFDREKTAMIVASVAHRCFLDRTKSETIQRQEAEARKPRGKYDPTIRCAIVAMAAANAARLRGESGRDEYHRTVLAELRKANVLDVADEYEERLSVRKWMAEPAKAVSVPDDDSELDQWRPQ